MRRIFLFSLIVSALVFGSWLWGPLQETALTQAPSPSAGPAGSRAAVDLASRALDHIPVGTVIGQDPPKGWTHLVLFATPTLTPEDLRDAPRMAADYARMFKFTILASVGRREGGQGPSFVLDKVARGFAFNLKGKETIINGNNTLGANLGMFGRRIIDENEQILDNEVRQVVRTDTMLIFDAKSVMLQKQDHVNMIMRHALLVDPATGQISTLVWLLTKDYQPAEEAIQALPNGMREARLLSVKRDQFTLGIPSREAFALRRIPQGKAIPYDDKLRQAATVKSFSADTVPEIEATLRAAAQQAAGK